jgi:hypothetical protein
VPPRLLEENPYRVGGPRLGPFKLSGTSGSLTAFDQRGWRH